MKMLAYVVKYEDAEWCMLVHGETQARAKYRFARCVSGKLSGFSRWDEIRLLRRLPDQDDKPFTHVNAKAIGLELASECFANDCDCPVCKERE